MSMRRLPFILMLALLPSLAGCNAQSAADDAPELSREALAAVKGEPQVGRTRLARAIDGVFRADEVGETRALVVMQGGRIVAERYAPGYGPQTRFVGWSMTKSITAVMIGMLVADGRLRLNESAPVPTWQRPGDPRGEITLKQLLQMRSGLRHTEMTPAIHDADTVRMLFLEGRGHTAAYAEAQPLEAVPGARFEYSSASSIILADVAAHALMERRDPAVRRRIVDEFLHTRLFEPLGMTSMIAEYDAAGTLAGSSLIHGSARDWARFGEFLRHGGSVRGAQLVPRGWIDFMTSPSPRNPAYGAHLWLNRSNSAGDDVLFPNKAPSSLFAATGHLGQYVIVSPQQGLTVVRLGHSNETERTALRERLGDLVALFPVR